MIVLAGELYFFPGVGKWFRDILSPPKFLLLFSPHILTPNLISMFLLPLGDILHGGERREGERESEQESE